MENKIYIGWGVILFVLLIVAISHCSDERPTLQSSNRKAQLERYQPTYALKSGDFYREAQKEEFVKRLKEPEKNLAITQARKSEEVLQHEMAQIQSLRKNTSSSEVFDPKAEINRNRESDELPKIFEPQHKNFVDIHEIIEKDNEVYERRRQAWLAAELARIKADQILKANKAEKEDNPYAYDRYAVIIVDLTEIEGVLRLGSANDFRRQWHSDRWQHAKEIIRTNKIIKQLNNL